MVNLHQIPPKPFDTAESADVRRISTPAGSEAWICANGAHVLSWRPAGEAEDRLFLSRKTGSRPGASIRGGIPVIFPQFGTLGKLPKHGFARTRNWRWADCEADQARLELTDDAQTREIWPNPFRLTLEAKLTDQSLEVILSVLNSGDQDASFTLALHTYLQVDDIASTRLSGLGGCRYLDATAQMAESLQEEGALSFGPECDRIYVGAPDVLKLEDVKRRLALRQSGFKDTVVWNPGSEKAAALADMDAHAEQHMLCVEAAIAEHPVSLAPGASWHGSQMLVVA